MDLAMLRIVLVCLGSSCSGSTGPAFGGRRTEPRFRGSNRSVLVFQFLPESFRGTKHGGHGRMMAPPSCAHYCLSLSGIIIISKGSIFR